MSRIKLTRSVFLKLHDQVLSRFQFEYEQTRWDFDDLGKYQIYGYSTFDKNKPNLPLSLENHEKIKRLLDEKEQEDPHQKIRPTINGQYLYSRYIKLNANEFAAPVTLAGIYAKIYFLYLGFDDLTSFLESAKKEKLLSNKEIEIQNILSNKKSNLEEHKKKYFTSYGFAFYSKKFHEIYFMELEIDYTPGIVKGIVENSPAFSVRSIETNLPKRVRAKKFKGIASYTKNILTINLLSTDTEEGLQIVLRAGKFENITSQDFFEGSYISRTRDSKIISGLAFLYKLKEGQTPTKIPPPLKQRLLSLRSQIRTKNNKTSLDRIKKDLEKSGYGKKLTQMTGNFYRLFVLNLANELVQLSLEIREDYSYTLKIVKTPAFTRRFNGKVRLLPKENTLYFEGIDVESKNEENKNSYYAAFIDVSLYSTEKLLKGTFTWTAERTKELFSGNCKMVWAASKPKSFIYRSDLEKPTRKASNDEYNQYIKEYADRLNDEYAKKAYLDLMSYRRPIDRSLYSKQLRVLSEIK